MTPPEPSRRSEVAPFLAMDMLREANAREADGEHVVHMEVGQPAGPPPAQVVEAASAALAAGNIGYTEALGIPALRARIARHYGEAYGLDVVPSRVVVTIGSSAGFILSFLAAFEHGARLALPVPGYPAYDNILTALGIEPVHIHTTADSRWAPTPEHIARAAGEGALAGLLVASPANPTGTMIDAAALERLCGECADRGMWFVSDEIYHRLSYSLDEACALSFNDDAIIVNSFSKYYCMTGWRIGWLVVPERLVRPMERLAQNLFISAPALSQHAALAAFDASEELNARRAVYARNRELLLERLPELGFTEFTPVDGAFYIYANVSGFANDSSDFARRMLAEIGVAVTPGADFDADNGHRYVRFSFAGSTDEMEEAVKRLKSWL